MSQIRLDIAPCISCKRMTPRSRALAVEDFQGSEVFVCLDCDAEFAEADRLADECDRILGGVA